MRMWILNVIIAASIIGIAGIWARDSFIIPKPTTTVVSPTSIPAISPTIMVDSQIPCQSKYFNFTPGTTWKYKASVNSVVSKKKSLQTYTITNTIKEASSSSARILSQKNNEKPVEIKLVCKQSGIYGFSFPFLPQTLSEASASGGFNIGSFLGSSGPLRFLPSNDKLKVGSSWEDNIGVQLKHTVKSQDENNVLEIVSTLTVMGFPIDLIQLSGKPQLIYHLKPSVGVEDFAFLMSTDADNSVQFSLKLVDFKEKREVLSPF